MRLAELREPVSTVRKLVGESQVRHDFFVGVYGVLTEEQHAALRPEIIRGRLSLDLYSESVL